MDEIKTCLCQYVGTIFDGLNGGLNELLEQHDYIPHQSEDFRKETKNSSIPHTYKKNFPTGQVLVETLDFRRHPEHPNLINDSKDYFTTLRLISTDERALEQARADLTKIHETRCLFTERYSK
ncbi:hypothetical protein GOV03_02290 [Candidatus Woesearchaeota archaeon]|nr:hypothetical protein [Candidatus Woesearchaeota archaeon]